VKALDAWHTMNTKRESPRLTKHQTRVLAALFVLTERHNCRWWSRDAIGRIVQAGGFHDVIQVATMRALKRLGLVRTEDSAWPEEVRQSVRCNCACYQWGLTDAGEAFAFSLSARWSPETEQRIANSLVARPAYERHDEDEGPRYEDRDDENEEEWWQK
jgi:hypothetical protein